MGNSKINTKIIYSSSPLQHLAPLIEQYGKEKTFLVTEDHVNELWEPDFLTEINSSINNKVVIASGESNKKIERSEEHTSELQSRPHLVCRLLLEKKKK